MFSLRLGPLFFLKKYSPVDKLKALSGLRSVSNLESNYGIPRKLAVLPLLLWNLQGAVGHQVLEAEEARFTVVGIDPGTHLGILGAWGRMRCKRNFPAVSLWKSEGHSSL